MEEVRRQVLEGQSRHWACVLRSWAGTQPERPHLRLWTLLAMVNFLKFKQYCPVELSRTRDSVSVPTVRCMLLVRLRT